MSGRRGPLDHQGLSPSRGGPLAEIEALRALAVLIVVLYHAHFGFSGGYVGVDVFFVVSGFLITGLLVRERVDTGRVSLAGFYARRARRLLPAASLVLVATVVAAAVLLNPLRANSTALDSAWSAVFLANVHFAQLGNDYLNSTAAPSLLQHWWSLAIEEQFYVVWPGLLMLVWSLGHRIERAAAIVCSAVVAASLGLCVWLTGRNPVWAYFAPWTRAWELAVGGLCALAFPMRSRIPWRGPLGWLGLAVITGSAVLLDESSTFPGVVALVPVLATAAVILSIGARRSPGVPMRIVPLQWIGARSYAIYLWHWPALVLLDDYWGTRAAAWRVAAIVASVGLAAASYVVVENPLRYQPRLNRSRSLSLSVGALLVLATLAGSVWVHSLTADVRVRTGFVAPTIPPATELVGPPTTTREELHTATTVPTTTAPIDPLTELQERVNTVLQPLIVQSTQQPLVPENITPPISKQAKDSPRVWGDGCLVTYFSSATPPCEYGDLTSTTTIVLLGDSHADQWFPAAEQAAIENHWKLVVMTKMKCSVSDLEVLYDYGRSYPTCSAWREAAVRRAAAPDVSVVLITQWRKHYEVTGRSGSPRPVTDAEWRAGLASTIGLLTSAGKKVLLLADAPAAHTTPDQCMATHQTNLTRCNLSEAVVVDHAQMMLERELADQLGVDYYDTSPWFCANGVCPVVIGNQAVYLDDHHINATYGLTLTPYVEALVRHQLLTG